VKTRTIFAILLAGILFSCRRVDNQTLDNSAISPQNIQPNETKDTLVKNIKIDFDTRQSSCLIKNIFHSCGLDLIVVDYTELTGTDADTDNPLYINNKIENDTFLLNEQTRIFMRLPSDPAELTPVSLEYFIQAKDEFINKRMWEIQVVNGVVIRLQEVFFSQLDGFSIE